LGQFGTHHHELAELGDSIIKHRIHLFLLPQHADDATLARVLLLSQGERPAALDDKEETT
jgi:hypothetical protein